MPPPLSPVTFDYSFTLRATAKLESTFNSLWNEPRKRSLRRPGILILSGLTVAAVLLPTNCFFSINFVSWDAYRLYEQLDDCLRPYLLTINLKSNTGDPTFATSLFHGLLPWLALRDAETLFLTKADFRYCSVSSCDTIRFLQLL